MTARCLTGLAGSRRYRRLRWEECRHDKASYTSRQPRRPLVTRRIGSPKAEAGGSARCRTVVKSSQSASRMETELPGSRPPVGTDGRGKIGCVEPALVSHKEADGGVQRIRNHPDVDPDQDRGILRSTTPSFGMGRLYCKPKEDEEGKPMVPAKLTPGSRASSFLCIW